MGASQEARKNPSIKELQSSKDAFADYIRSLVPKLAATVRRIGIPPHAVDDVLQEVFFSFSRIMDRLPSDMDPTAYLRVAAARRSISYFRGETRQRGGVGTMSLEATQGASGDQMIPPSPIDVQTEVIDTLIGSNSTEIFDRLGILNINAQTFFLLRAEGFTDAEIAKITGKNPVTVRTRMHKGRRAAEEADPSLHITRRRKVAP